MSRWNRVLRQVRAGLMVIGALAGLACSEGIDPPSNPSPQTPLPSARLDIPPAGSERVDERNRMVDEQIAGRGIVDATVLEALRTVPRHWFVTEAFQDLAYADSPLPIEQGQTISQPFIVALMTQALQLKSTDKVLEIGTGSGYQAAVLSEITPRVWTIEIDETLAEGAKSVFEKRGYGGIQCRAGDGYLGWPEAAPFDAIIITAAPPRIPQPLKDQLAVGGRLVVPLGNEGEVQVLKRFTKTADGELAGKTLEMVRFVPMTGKVQHE